MDSWNSRVIGNPYQYYYAIKPLKVPLPTPPPPTHLRLSAAALIYHLISWRRVGYLIDIVNENFSTVEQMDDSGLGMLLRR